MVTMSGFVGAGSRRRGVSRGGGAPVLIALTVGLVALLGLPLGAASARAAVPVPAMGYGFAGGAAQALESAADYSREMDAVAATGASWHRVLVDWRRAEPSKGNYSWAETDKLINGASSRGLNVLANFLSTPGWAGGGWPTYTNPPRNLDDTVPFVKAFMARYPQVTHFEIWNEPNLRIFWGGGSDPAGYTALLKKYYTTIKSVNPAATVIAAGMSPFSGGVDYYKRMYAAGAKGYFDAAAYHPYSFPWGPDVTPNGVTETADLHNLMVAQGDGGKKVWLTELGTPANPTGKAVAPPALRTGIWAQWFGKNNAPTGRASDMTTPEVARQQTLRTLAIAAGVDWTGPAFIYTVRDSGTSSTDREQNFGALLSNDWKPEPLAADLAR